jgi:hypothetical protein
VGLVFKFVRVFQLHSIHINNGVMQSVSGQHICKHVTTATNTNTVIKLLLEMVLSTRSLRSSYKEDNWGDPVSCQFAVASCVLHGRL